MGSIGGMDGGSPGRPENAGHRWMRAGVKVQANSAAKRMREAARMKALQRTPYPMVLARVKLLLDRLQVGEGCVHGCHVCVVLRVVSWYVCVIDLVVVIVTLVVECGCVHVHVCFQFV